MTLDQYRPFYYNRHRSALVLERMAALLDASNASDTGRVIEVAAAVLRYCCPWILGMRAALSYN